MLVVVFPVNSELETSFKASLSVFCSKLHHHTSCFFMPSSDQNAGKCYDTQLL